METATSLTTVWKFQLGHGNVTRIALNMPVGASILAVRVQRDVPCLWAWVDPDAPAIKRTFVIVGTGYTVPNGATYLDTFELFGGDFIGHVFEVNP